MGRGGLSRLLSLAHTRRQGGVGARLIFSDSPSPACGGEALIGFSAPPPTASQWEGGVARGTLDFEPPASPSPFPVGRVDITRLFGLALAPSPVGRGGPARLFGLALARCPRRSRQWDGREALLNFSASLSPTWGGDAARHFNPALAHLPVGRGEPRPRPLASGEGRPRSSFRPRPRPPAAPLAPMGRFSALRLHPRPLGEVASLVSSASSLPTSQWGGEALLGYSASPSLTGRAARASGKGAPLSSRLGGATPIGSSTSPSPTRQWGGGSLALPHSPVGRGGPTRLFSLALAR